MRNWSWILMYVSYLLANASVERPAEIATGLDFEDEELDTIYQSEPGEHHHQSATIAFD